MKPDKKVITPIRKIQGKDLWSPLAGQDVTVRGVVTAVGRRGFYIQDVNPGADPLVSDAVFVFSPKWPAPENAYLEVSGQVIDYARAGSGKPVTQIKLENVRLIKRHGPPVKPFELTADNVPADMQELAVFLNGLEGMLVTIAAGQTFIAPSNPFGDYVLILDADKPVRDVLRTAHGGVLVEQDNPLRWYPGFRIKDYKIAPRVNVGSKLLSRITGPLNYRVEAFQIAVSDPIEIERLEIERGVSELKPTPGFLSVMTLNTFNLDMHVESASMVKNPGQDIDDDWGDGRFRSLARAVVLQANVPDIIALQEIQDNDGAELTMVVSASETYQGLIKSIREFCEVQYRWVDIEPGVGTDGGQPGGSIRNGYLYNPERVDVVADSVRLIGADEAAFEGSRKPLLVNFREKESGNELVCINVHLASKRHQHGIFSPERAGHDEKLQVRIEQAEIIRNEMSVLQQQGQDYYLTGDFNDTEGSETLAVLVGENNANLVNLIAPEQRYDYNHRGKLQVLMHGIVPKTLAQERVEYDIIHGNELIGVQPGQSSDKPSDHAYVLARINMSKADKP